MINHYDIAYGLGVGISSPFWLAKPSSRRKVLRAFSQRMGHVPARDLSKPGIMIHAVSLGEINATPSLISVLRAQRPGIEFIVSVTTETGYTRGQELYGSATDVTLVRYPLDFTAAVERLLDALRPAVVVLLELEVWPNFIRRCAQRKVPVILINGRISANIGSPSHWLDRCSPACNMSPRRIRNMPGDSSNSASLQIA
jgi:3-deoxy-D-manno-octulosonic-acid transferase